MAGWPTATSRLAAARQADISFQPRDAERDEALTHIELQISFIREVTYRHLRPVRSVSGSTARKAA
jgi:hypothetical protein